MPDSGWVERRHVYKGCSRCCWQKEVVACISQSGSGKRINSFELKRECAAWPAGRPSNFLVLPLQLSNPGTVLL